MGSVNNQFVIATVDESPEVATSSEEQIDVSAVNGAVSEFESLFDRLGNAEDDPNWSVLNTWLIEDANDLGYQIMNDEEIVEDVLQVREVSESENEDEAPSSAVAPSQACAAFDTALEWLESKGNTYPAHLMLVKSWRDDAAQRRLKFMKQTKITSYFK